MKNVVVVLISLAFYTACAFFEDNRFYVFGVIAPLVLGTLGFHFLSLPNTVKRALLACVPFVVYGGLIPLGVELPVVVVAAHSVLIGLFITQCYEAFHWLLSAAFEKIQKK